jgi:hypothetical protein
VEHERNVVAAFVSTAEHVRNTGSKPRRLAQVPLQLFCYHDSALLPLAENGGTRERHRWIDFSEDDINNRRGRRYQAGKPHANPLRTTRSTLAILRDDIPFVPLPKTKVRESVLGGSGFSEDDVNIAEGANIKRASRTPTR